MYKKPIIIGAVSAVLATIAWLFFVILPEFQEHATVVVSPSVQELLEPTASPSVTPPADMPAQNEEQPPAAEDGEPQSASGPLVIPPAYTIEGVPFMSQAPSTNWELPFKEACEEASVVMVNRFYTKRPLGSVEDQDKIIVDMAVWGEEHMGAIDTDLETTARYFTEYLSYDPRRITVIRDITIDDIKAVIASGRPVIVPAAGRELGNEYFREPGPIYHMLVVIGYDRDEFITHDPGTRHGEQYRYKQDVLYNAIHDLTPDIERIAEGRKSMLVVSP